MWLVRNLVGGGGGGADAPAAPIVDGVGGTADETDDAVGQGPNKANVTPPPHAPSKEAAGDAAGDAAGKVLASDDVAEEGLPVLATNGVAADPGDDPDMVVNDTPQHGETRCYS